MGPWLDQVEVMADQWAVPLENTTYLRDVNEYWSIYGQAKDMLNRANDTLSSRPRNADSRQPVVKASKNLQDMLWKAAEDLNGVRSHTEFLADTLQQAIRQKSATDDQLRVEMDQGPSSKEEVDSVDYTQDLW